MLMILNVHGDGEFLDGYYAINKLFNENIFTVSQQMDTWKVE